MKVTLTDRQRTLLRWLDDEAYRTPMDLGGRDGSHHSRTLRQLVSKGYATRRVRGSLLNQIRGAEYYAYLSTRKRHRSAARGSYDYRRTVAGKKALAWKPRST